MTVYALVPRAIYDHGIIGVYATEDDARAAGEDIWSRTDGHHRLVIIPLELGATNESVFCRAHHYRDNEEGWTKEPAEIATEAQYDYPY